MYWEQRGRFSRRRALGAAALGSGAVALLGACGVKGRGSNASTASRQGGTPQPGGTLNVPLPTDFFNFDTSGNGKTVPNPNATMLAYDTVLGFQEGSNVPFDANVIAPKLAERWETPDAQTTIFHLRNGLKFANLAPVNGRALTSADVQWSFEYHSRTGQLKNSKLPRANFDYMFAGLDSLETPDPATVRVHFSQPFAPFLTDTATNSLPIVPHEIYDQDGDFSKRVAGSGPFQLDVAASQRGTRWVFKKNPEYWQSGKPYLDQINYLVIADMASVQAAFQTHQIDIVPSLALNGDLQTAAIIKKNNPDAVVQEGFAPQAQGLFICERRPPFNDVRMRQALSLAIDRDEFDKTFSGGKAGWVMSDALPGLWTQAEIKQILKYDPQQAKQLVIQAGYPNGVDAEAMIKQGTTPVAAVELLQAQLKKVGINIVIAPVDSATQSKRLHSGDFTLYPESQALSADPDIRFYGNFFSTSPSNYIGVKDPKLDQLILAQRQEIDPAKRKEDIKVVNRYMADNAINVALYRKPISVFWKPALKNYADNWQSNDLNAPNIWLQR